MNKQPKHISYNFSFEGFRIIEIKFSINKDFNLVETEWAEINPQIGMDANFDSDSKHLNLKMGIRENNPKSPFTFEIIGEGLFKFNNAPDSEFLSKISSINCPAIMFPYLRETVADITMRSGYAPLHLAPVNFVSLAKQKSKHKKTNP